MKGFVSESKREESAFFFAFGDAHASQRGRRCQGCRPEPCFKKLFEKSFLKTFKNFQSALCFF